MENNITQFSKCANCGACMNTCPNNAIVLDSEDYFYKYVVDESKCTQCGACVRVCPLNNLKPHLGLVSAYGGQHIDKSVVKTSSSGGAFTAIADYVLSNGGIVFGAAYEDDYKAVVINNTDETTLDSIKRSKYVESAVLYSFRSVKAELQKDRFVLFCGTPCQVAGLKAYLHKEYDNLLTIDFACGGLASHKIYASYIDALEKKYRGKTSAVNFRSGLYGWKNHYLEITFDNNRTYEMFSEIDPYTYSFMSSHCANRENCFECKFRNNHYSDFIIADFWRWFEYSNLENDETGISLILTNSQKGDELLKTEIKRVMHLEQLDLNQAMYNCFVKPPITEKVRIKRNQFFADYEKYGLRKAAVNSGMLHGLKATMLKRRLRKDGRKA